MFPEKSVGFTYMEKVCKFEKRITFPWSFGPLSPLSLLPPSPPLPSPFLLPLPPPPLFPMVYPMETNWHTCNKRKKKTL